MSPNPSYISIATTAKRLNKSIRTIWRWTNQKKAEGFPQPIKLSAGTTVLDFEECCVGKKKRKQALSCNYFSKNFPRITN